MTSNRKLFDERGKLFFEQTDDIANKLSYKVGTKYMVEIDEQAVVDRLRRDDSTLEAAMKIVALVLDVYGVEWENLPVENRYAILLTSNEMLKARSNQRHDTNQKQSM